MTKQELIDRLKLIVDDYSDDEEKDHIKADQLLLMFIDDNEVSQAFHEINKWYA